jgi:hypothetical protein
LRPNILFAALSHGLCVLALNFSIRFQVSGFRFQLSAFSFPLFAFRLPRFRLDFNLRFHWPPGLASMGA